MPSPEASWHCAAQYKEPLFVPPDYRGAGTSTATVCGSEALCRGGCFGDYYEKHRLVICTRMVRFGWFTISTYWAVPEMRFAEHFVETDAASIRTARRSLSRQSDTRATNLLMQLTPARLVRYFTPGLFVIARK